MLPIKRIDGYYPDTVYENSFVYIVDNLEFAFLSAGKSGYIILMHYRDILGLTDRLFSKEEVEKCAKVFKKLRAFL